LAERGEAADPGRSGGLPRLAPGDPERVGPYRILGRLGAGGAGTVFLGRASDGPRVAVKVLRPELAGDPAFLRMFRHEVGAARRVVGFCTARVLDADISGPLPYLVTEYVEGVRLDRAVAASGRLSVSDLEGLAVGMAAALTAIHGAGVVHRDLKPSNVLLSYLGPKVIDFGIARALDASASTATGKLMGSPGWMAPEQFAQRPVTAAVDIFVWAPWSPMPAPGGDRSGRARWWRCPPDPVRAARPGGPRGSAARAGRGLHGPGGGSGDGWPYSGWSRWRRFWSPGWSCWTGRRPDSRRGPRWPQPASQPMRPLRPGRHHCASCSATLVWAARSAHHRILQIHVGASGSTPDPLLVRLARGINRRLHQRTGCPL